MKRKRAVLPLSRDRGGGWRDLTDAERELWYALRAHRLGGLSFRRQAPCGPFIVDFFCAEARLIVEIDGATHSSDSEIACDKRRAP